MEVKGVRAPEHLPSIRADLLSDDALQRLRELAEPECVLCLAKTWEEEEWE